MNAAKKFVSFFVLSLTLVMLLAFLPTTVHAEEPETASETTETVTVVPDNSAGLKALAAAFTVGLAAAAGALGMGMAISKSVEGIARQPEAEGKIRTSLMLGLVFVETAIIYALIIAVLIIFVL